MTAPSQGGRSARGERGSGSVLTLGVAAVGVALAATVIALGESQYYRHRAEDVADQAALAGADVALRGGEPCAQARALARASGANPLSCSADAAGRVRVVVGFRCPSWSCSWLSVTARSMAGPVVAGVA